MSRSSIVTKTLGYRHQKLVMNTKPTFANVRVSFVKANRVSYALSVFPKILQNYSSKTLFTNYLVSIFECNLTLNVIISHWKKSSFFFYEFIVKFTEPNK